MTRIKQEAVVVIQVLELLLEWEECRCIGHELIQRSSSLSPQSYSLNSLQVGLATQERRAATVLPTSYESMAMLMALGTLMDNSATSNSAMHWGAIANSRLVGLRQAVVVEPSRYRLSKATNFHSRFHEGNQSAAACSAAVDTAAKRTRTHWDRATQRTGRD